MPMRLELPESPVISKNFNNTVSTVGAIQDTKGELEEPSMNETNDVAMYKR